MSYTWQHHQLSEDLKFPYSYGMLWPLKRVITGDFYGIIHSINGVLLVFITVVRAITVGRCLKGPGSELVWNGHYLKICLSILLTSKKNIAALLFEISP